MTLRRKEQSQQSMEIKPLMNFSSRELVMEGVLIGGELNRLHRSHSWSSCSEEIKTVMRGSLHRQNTFASSSRSMECNVAEGRRNRSAKMKAPNLIARLMGLEAFPAEAAAETTRKQQNGENLDAPGRLMSIEQTPKVKRVTLRCMIERERMEQLMKRSGQEVGDCGSYSDSSCASSNEQCNKGLRMDEKGPPPYVKAMELPPWEEQGDLASRRTPSQELVRPSKDEGQANESVRKYDLSLKKSKAELSSKKNIQASVCHGQQKKESVNSVKRTGEGRKPISNRTSPRSKKDVNFAVSPLSQAKRSATSSTEPAKGVSTVKSIVPKSLTPQKTRMIPQRKSAPRNSTNPVAEKKTTGSKPVQRIAELKKDSKVTSPSCKTEDALKTNILPAAEPPKQKKLISKSSKKEKAGKDQKIICEVMPRASKIRFSSVKAEETVKNADNELGANKVERLEGLLLSCQSFLMHAYELSLDAQTPMSHEKTDHNKDNKNAKLYLCCADELILRKRYFLELGSHPMLLNCSWSSLYYYISLDQIVTEISKAIRRLSNYSEADDGVASKDSLYVMLERDLRCKDTMLNAMWDMGWWNSICTEAADLVVGQVEDQVLSEIIEETAVDLVIQKMFFFLPACYDI